MKKGKGTEPMFRSRCRGFAAPVRPAVTRLTRTTGFMELPGAPCAPGSIDASGDDSEFRDRTPAFHWAPRPRCPFGRRVPRGR